MALKEIIQGNDFTLRFPLTLNDATITDLAAADIVRVKVIRSDGSVFLESDTTNPNVTIDDPAVGTVQWVITSAQSTTLTPGTYTVAVQREDLGVILELNTKNAFKIIDQYIA